ncbi:hypothetical protein OpiT1DRAFT_02475 [Opitutaceae bacterium TAV1]|nr:hypothetical protein OpiT1DRAFT_02475 [Opitutaceae bacterium TAV1]
MLERNIVEAVPAEGGVLLWQSPVYYRIPDARLRELRDAILFRGEKRE